MTSRYPIGDNLQQTSTLLGISAERVLRRVGLSATLASDGDIYVTADTYFKLWDAACAEANRPAIEMDLAMAYAHGPFLPPIFAFSCADTLALGLERLAVFKPLIGPIVLKVERSSTALTVTLSPSEPGIEVSPSLGLFELIYITECARTFTGCHVIPLATTLPKPHPVDPACTDYLGGAPSATGAVSLTFSQEDADRSLITRSASLWETLDPSFLEQLQARTESGTLAVQIKRTLTEALPGGASSVNDMAKRLNISKRSLQRRLSEEGTNFQELLQETRFEMSERYLKNSALSVPEISHLLGFRDTSSFFRAFQAWTGTTPGDYRSVEAPKQSSAPN